MAANTGTLSVGWGVQKSFKRYNASAQYNKKDN